MYPGERLNGYTHLLGTLLAAAGTAILVVMAARRGDVWRVVSFSVYGATLFLLYFLSTMYHSVRGRAKRIFQKLDHLAIYLLIAGTYTPFTLVTLNGAWGWSLFGVIWALALIGMVLDAWPRRGSRNFTLIIYLLMGWLALIALGPLIRALPVGGLVGLLAGGISYTVGIIFYALDERMRHAHGIWHIFVLAGSAFHFFTILYYVA